MATFIEGGAMTFDALTYGSTHPNTLNFLSAQFQNPTASLVSAGQEFVERAASLFEQFNGSQALRAMKSAARGLRSLWQMDEIRPLSTVGQMQFAPLTMQRWIMAEPSIRELYHKNACDGYSDTYIDMHPNDIGEAHYDYRRVMNGLVLETNEDHAYEWTATTYLDDLVEGDTELTLEEQLDIQTTWNFMKHHMSISKEDPTSIYCNELDL
jgi:hypothetical protein